MARPTRSFVLSAIFITLINVPFVVHVFGLDPHANNREYRRAAAFPPVPTNLAAVGDWPRGLQRYYDDNFGLRDVLTDLYASGLYHGLGVVPFSQVDVRHDGWLFARLPGGLACQPMAGAELESTLRRYAQARELAERAGSEYLLVLVPSKEFVYRPRAPELACAPRNTTVGAIAERLKRGDPAFPVLDLFGPLVAAKRSERVYFLDDPHWDDVGAFVGYTEIVRALAARFPGLVPHRRSDFRAREIEHEEGAYSRLTNLDFGASTDVFLEPKYVPRAHRTAAPQQNVVGLWHYEQADVIFEQDDPSLPTALVFRNSFFEQVRPWLAEHFRRVVYVWHAFDPERASRERADIVIEEMSY